jgi:2-iminobutanoate/2-iminopropanoate deaminase
MAGGIAMQTKRVLANIEAVLIAAGVGFGEILKPTVYLKDLGDFATMNELYGSCFTTDGVSAPARSTVQVVALPKGSLIEIDCISVVCSYARAVRTIPAASFSLSQRT